MQRMLDRLTSIPERLTLWIGGLSGAALIGVGVVIMASVAGGGYYAYETYDYIQHDNDFCVSCHLMQQPFELFSKSAHQGLGCKACHQPTLVARSEMALAQIIENPEEISSHAEVPNELCAECHIRGDPDKWRLIAASAGHRVHLESNDPVLDGLQCVECHSTSVHQFASTDQTCGQSSCHSDKKGLLLAGMTDLTVHCLACHNFLAPVNTVMEVDSVSAQVDRAILPDQEECFSCHAMRSLASMPDPDPHGGRCASCHNPHEQKTPGEAVQSCTNAGCHTDAAVISPMHRGLQPGVLEGCTSCHKAHDFQVRGTRCIDCHQGLDGEGATLQGGGHVGSGDDTEMASVVTGDHPPQRWGVSVTSYLTGAGVGIGWWLHPDEVVQERPIFRHAQHRAVTCTNCHSNADAHGELSVITLNDCRSCHHRAPVSNDCSRCHSADDAPDAPLDLVRPVRFSVGQGDPSRALTFDHDRHGTLTCDNCHTEGISRSAAQVDCGGCHSDHHEPTNDCVSCHRTPAADAHLAVESHLTCSGSGCHTPSPFEVSPRTRSSCVVCHQDKEEHRAPRVCVECHALPDPRGSGREDQS